jgi:acyl-CoA synthetase (AMP-forming)/AMP-acid ligase II
MTEPGQWYLDRTAGKVVYWPVPGEEMSEAEVLAHCNAHMAHFKCPKRVVFTDSLPKNPSGKLLKRELRRSHGG